MGENTDETNATTNEATNHTDSAHEREPIGLYAVARHEEEGFISHSWVTREGAIAEAAETLGLSPGDAFVTGFVIPASAPTIHAQQILETLAEGVLEEGEHTERYCDELTSPGPEAEAELQAGLNQLLHAWMMKHGLMPTYFSVEDVERHVVPDAVER